MLTAELTADDCPTARQRAARIAHKLTMLTITSGQGMSTIEIAELLGMTRQGAHDLMCDISGAGGAPVYQSEGKWHMLVEYVRHPFSLN